MQHEADLAEASRHHPFSHAAVQSLRFETAAMIGLIKLHLTSQKWELKVPKHGRPSGVVSTVFAS